MPFVDACCPRPQPRPLAPGRGGALGVSEINSPFARQLSSKLVGLTPKELEVARLVKEGKGSSEIAQILAVSENAVAFHRRNIRTKLGLKRKGLNLCSYLMNMS